MDLIVVLFFCYFWGLNFNFFNVGYCRIVFVLVGGKELIVSMVVSFVEGV